MRYALPLVLLLLGLFLPFSAIAQTTMVVEAPDIVAPGETIIIKAEFGGNATNVTVTYKVCTNSLCGYPTTMPMTQNGTNAAIYAVDIPPQENGYYITYQINALVDGAPEASEEMRLDISAIEEVSSSKLELYTGLTITGAIVLGTLILVFLSNKRGGEDETREDE